MNEKEIIRKAMSERGVSQAKLAALAGFKSQSNVSQMLNETKAGGTRVANFVKAMSALGYEIDIADKESGELKWVLDMRFVDPNKWIKGSGNYKCPKCGEIVDEMSKFCPNCGNKFNLEKE